MAIRLRPIAPSDLELMLAWRNHPDVYAGFYEQGHLGKGHLTWEEHSAFWLKRLGERNKDWEVWIISYESRDVGVVWVSELNSSVPEVGIYIGEVTLHGRGVGKQTLGIIKDALKARGYSRVTAKILEDNKKSIGLFESCGFRKVGRAREGEWMYEADLG